MTTAKRQSKVTEVGGRLIHAADMIETRPEEYAAEGTISPRALLLLPGSVTLPAASITEYPRQVTIQEIHQVDDGRWFVWAEDGHITAGSLPALLRKLAIEGCY